MTILRKSNNLNDSGVWTAEGGSTFVTSPFNDGDTAWKGNGSNARLVDQGGSGIFSSGDNTFTISGWLKLLNTPAGQRAFISNDDFNQNGFGGVFFWTSNDRQMACTVYKNTNATVDSISVNSVLTVGTDHYVSAVCNGNTMALYIDGVVVSYASQDTLQNGGFNPGFAGTPASMFVGGSSTTVDRYSDSEMYRWTWFSEARNASQILADFNAEIAARDALPIITRSRKSMLLGIRI